MRFMLIENDVAKRREGRDGMRDTEREKMEMRDRRCDEEERVVEIENRCYAGWNIEWF